MFNHCLCFPPQYKFHEAEIITIYFTTLYGIESAVAEIKTNEPGFYLPGSNDGRSNQFHKKPFKQQNRIKISIKIAYTPCEEKDKVNHYKARGFLEEVIFF